MNVPGWIDPFAGLPGLTPPMEPTPAPPVRLPEFLAWRLLGLAAGLAQSVALMALASAILVLVGRWKDVTVGRPIAVAAAAWAVSVALRTWYERTACPGARL